MHIFIHKDIFALVCLKPDFFGGAAQRHGDNLFVNTRGGRNGDKPFRQRRRKSFALTNPKNMSL